MNDLQIEFAISLSKYKNFSLAEKNIYVSQSIIRSQITALEKELGVQLFIRAKQAVTLTEEGKIIIEAFKANKKIQDQAIERAKQLNSSDDDILNIGYLQFMCDFESLNQSLQKARAKHPSAFFQFICDYPAQLNALLNDGSIDVIITAESEIEQHDDINYIDFDEFDRAVILSSRHPLAQKDRIDLSMLKNEQIFIFSPEGYQGLSSYMKIVLDTFGVSRSDIIVLPNVGSMFASIEAGLGVGVFAATPAIYGSTAVKCFPINGQRQRTVLSWKRNNKKKLLREFVKIAKSNHSIK